MNIASQRAYCKEFSSHLRYIADKLFNLGLIKDITPLQTAASQYRTTLKPDIKLYSSFLDSLKFENIDPDKKFKKTRPQSFDSETGMELTLSVDLIGKVPNEEVEDPFTKLEINIELLGFDSDLNDLINCWHIDRHILAKEGEEEEESPYFPHPLYHIQYGGRKMTNREDLNYGNILVIDSPRISFPPMDIILTLDYVIANYYGKIWYELKDDIRYNEAISYSREKIWRPYFRSISDGLSSEKKVYDSFLYSLINPHLT